MPKRVLQPLRSREIAPFRHLTIRNTFRDYLVIDRADGIVTICEMKYSKDDYTLDEREYRNIVRRMETFQKETGHKGGIQVSLVTTYGLHENMYSEISPIPITMEELFIYE